MQCHGIGCRDVRCPEKEAGAVWPTAEFGMGRVEETAVVDVGETLVKGQAFLWGEWGAAVDEANVPDRRERLAQGEGGRRMRVIEDRGEEWHRRTKCRPGCERESMG